MSFNEGQQIELHVPLGHPVDGKHPVIRGRITKLMHGHAIVCFESITEGLRLAVKPTGQLVVLGKMDTLEKDWKELKKGDIEAVPVADICAVEQPKQVPAWITREQAEHLMGKYSDSLDGLIEQGSIQQSVEGLLRTSDVGFCRAALPTFIANRERELLMGAEEQAKAQEARRYVERVGQLSSR